MALPPWERTHVGCRPGNVGSSLADAAGGGWRCTDACKPSQAWEMRTLLPLIWISGLRTRKMSQPSGQSKCIHPSLRLRLDHPLAICLWILDSSWSEPRILPESVAKMKRLGMQRNKSECKSLLHEKIDYSKLEGKSKGERKLPWRKTCL